MPRRHAPANKLSPDFPNHDSCPANQDFGAGLFFSEYWKILTILSENKRSSVTQD
jgi:hypothetical protein